MGSALAFPRIVSSLAKCFYKICRMFGKTFVDKKVFLLSFCLFLFIYFALTDFFHKKYELMK